MSQGRTTPIWPLNVVMLFAFAMSVTAPRCWERVAHRTALAPIKSPAARSVAVGEWASTDGNGPGGQHGQPRSPLPDWGRLAQPKPRVAAELATALSPAETRNRPTLDVSLPATAAPTLAPSGDAIPFVTPPTDPFLPPPERAVPITPPTIVAPIAVTPVAESVIEETPTLDRPRLWGGLRTSTPQIVAVVTPKPEVSVALRPSTPAVPNLPTIEPAPAPVVAPEIKPGPTLTPPQPAAPSTIELAKIPTAPAAPIVTPTPAPLIEPKEPPSWWPTPVDLMTRLEALQTQAATRTWAERTTATLDGLLHTTDVAAPGAAARMAELRRAAADSLHLDEHRLDEATAVELRLARYALVRRLDVWESLSAAVRNDIARREAPKTEGLQRLEVCLAEITAQTDAAGDTGRQWREYLLIDALSGACSRPDEEQRLQIVREALARLHKADASAEHEFLREGPFAELRVGLERLGEEEIDARRLLLGLERFEQGGLPSDAHDLAEECERLAMSTDAARQNLAVWLNSHYRNANLRVSFSPELLNRLLPDSLKRQQPINETILGKETRGWGSTRTGLTIRFVPHPDRVSVVLTADGVVNAQTRTLSGPVRLFSASNSTFTAQKEIELSPAGVVVKPAKALTKNNTRLRGIESDFDGMPILDGIITAIAQNKHAEMKSAAQREAAAKTTRQVERHLDEDFDKYLGQADGKLHTRLIEPLSRLQISPEILDLQSTEQRATIRLRSAGSDQLAANTPRPRAYADNLGSVQIHQSAINNVLDRLDLAGRRFTIRELYQYLTTTMNAPADADLSNVPEELSIAFAATDAMTIRCDDGRLELRLTVDELRHGDRSWRNFTIRAPFRPETIDGVMYFVRDGVVRISGSQLGTGQQISLRTVFAKVFAEDLRVRLWPKRLVDDPRFADLDIAQIDLRDGWIGIAIGPRPEAAAPLDPALPGAATPPAIGGGVLKALRR